MIIWDRALFQHCCSVRCPVLCLCSSHNTRLPFLPYPAHYVRPFTIGVAVTWCAGTRALSSLLLFRVVLPEIPALSRLSLPMYVALCLGQWCDLSYNIAGTAARAVFLLRQSTHWFRFCSSAGTWTDGRKCTIWARKRTAAATMTRKVGTRDGPLGRFILFHSPTITRSTILPVS